MQIGRIASQRISTPIIRDKYNDIIRKSNNIKNKAELINELYNNLLRALPEPQMFDIDVLIGEIGDCFENIYSCLEYSTTILNEIFEFEKGNWPPSFHDILKKTIKNSDVSSKYNNSILKSFVDSALSWFAIVHDIRSEYTHHSMGAIIIDDGKLIYRVVCKAKKETLYELLQIKESQGRNVKSITKPGEYNLLIKDINAIYLGYIRTIYEIEEFILNSNFYLAEQGK